MLLVGADALVVAVEVLEASASAPPLAESLLSPLLDLLLLSVLLLSLLLSLPLLLLLVALESLDPEPEPVVADWLSLVLASAVVLLDAEAVALPAAVEPPSPVAVGAEADAVAAP